MNYDKKEIPPQKNKSFSILYTQYCVSRTVFIHSTEYRFTFVGNLCSPSALAHVEGGIGWNSGGGSESEEAAEGGCRPDSETVDYTE